MIAEGVKGVTGEYYLQLKRKENVCILNGMIHRKKTVEDALDRITERSKF